MTPFVFDYTNWRGEKGQRRVHPERVYFGSTEYHPAPQWLMEAWDLDKEASRVFAMRDIRPCENDNSRWTRIDDFRGEPNTTPMAWWWNTTWAGHGYLEIDEVLLGEEGEVVGKGKCGADYCTHVKLVREGELPIPPK